MLFHMPTIMIALLVLLYCALLRKQAIRLQLVKLYYTVISKKEAKLLRVREKLSRHDASKLRSILLQPQEQESSKSRGTIGPLIADHQQAKKLFKHSRYMTKTQRIARHNRTKESTEPTITDEELLHFLEECNNFQIQDLERSPS